MAPPGHSGQHVALGHAAILARAGHGRADRLLSASSLAAAGMATSPLAPPAAAAAAGAGAAAGRLREQRRQRQAAARTGLALGVDLGDELLGHHGATIADHDLGQHASCGCGHFEHDLVGFDFDQDFVGATASPAFFFQVSMVASATDSDSWGTLTSTIAILNSFQKGVCSE
jgi:hypothetical protein